MAIHRLFNTDHLRVSETAAVTLLTLGIVITLLALPFALTGDAATVLARALGILLTLVAVFPLLWAFVRYRGRLQPVVWLCAAGGVLVNVLTWSTEPPFA